MRWHAKTAIRAGKATWPWKNRRNVPANESNRGRGGCAGPVQRVGARIDNVRSGLVDRAHIDSRPLDIGAGGGIQRQMKGERAKRAKAVVRKDLCLGVEAPNRVSLMVMADGEQLGAKD